MIEELPLIIVVLPPILIENIPEDIIELDESNSKKLRKETNLPNFEINKKYNKDNILVNYEDWNEEV